MSLGHHGKAALPTPWPWAGVQQSPLTFAANWKTPMLLSVGERDFRVPIGNTLETWATLRDRLGIRRDGGKSSGLPQPYLNGSGPLLSGVLYVAATYFAASTKAVSRLRNSELLTLPSWFVSII